MVKEYMTFFPRLFPSCYRGILGGLGGVGCVMKGHGVRVCLVVVIMNHGWHLLNKTKVLTE